MIRGKFRVTTITRNHYNPNSAEVVLEALYSQTPEDNSYAAATPSAKIVMQITNPAAVNALPLGKAFYVDFTEVPE